MARGLSHFLDPPCYIRSSIVSSAPLYYRSVILPSVFRALCCVRYPPVHTALLLPPYSIRSSLLFACTPPSGSGVFLPFGSRHNVATVSPLHPPRYPSRQLLASLTYHLYHPFFWVSAACMSASVRCYELCTVSIGDYLEPHHFSCSICNCHSPDGPFA